MFISKCNEIWKISGVFLQILKEIIYVSNWILLIVAMRWDSFKYIYRLTDNPYCE